jgi:transcriptional regulator GlxA family with amidase domain
VEVIGHQAVRVQKPAEAFDDVRRQTAHRLLSTTDLPIGQVANMVGFAEQSALSRAARRWWDGSPRQVRRTGRSSESHG